MIAIVATDAPLLPGSVQGAGAARPARPGADRHDGIHFSGDIFLAFSTGNPASWRRDGRRRGGAYGTLRFVPWVAMDPFFEAVVQATEEAVLNALVANEEMTGVNGRRSPGLPHDRVRELLAARGVTA